MYRVKDWCPQARLGGFALVFVAICLARADLDPAWENIFKTRSDSDWRSLWHNERHVRCYQDLLVHMEWVCEKDIYKLRRKRDSADQDLEPEQDPNDSSPGVKSLFLDSGQAASILGFTSPSRIKRLKGGAGKRGIIDECCHGANGCSWEEYAEYCPANRRVRT